MDNLLVILVVIFSGVALMVVLGERFAKPTDPEKMQKLQRWILPLVGLSLVLSLGRYYWPG
jgi:cadmium resistance protein CadD (predicted permease)